MPSAARTHRLRRQNQMSLPQAQINRPRGRSTTRGSTVLRPYSTGLREPKSGPLADCPADRLTRAIPVGTIRFMTDGFVMGSGEGKQVSPAMTLKVGDEHSQSWSMFEVADIGPGFDVGAHLHRNAEELFYVLEGELDLLAFEPRIRTPGNWQSWESRTGVTVARGGPGSMMYVPRGCPHAF